MRGKSCLPPRQGDPEGAFDLAKLVGEIRLSHPGFDGVAKASVSRHPSLSPKKSPSQRRHHLRRGCAEGERTPKGADRLAGPAVLQQRLAQSPEEIGRRHALLRVLDPDSEHFLGLLDLTQVDASAAQQAQALGDERTRIGGEQLPFGRPQEDRQGRRPAAQELNDA